MNVNEPRAVHDVHRSIKLLVRLAGKADDDIRRQRKPVETLAHTVDHPQKVIARVLAIHPSQESVRAALQREVKVRDNLSVGAERIDQVIRQIARFQTAQPQAAEIRDARA